MAGRHIDHAEQHANSSTPDSEEDTVPPLKLPPTSASRGHHPAASNIYGPRRSSPKSSSSPVDNPQHMSSGSTDRVFPMRSFVSVDTSSTPAVRPDREDGYFHGVPTSTAKRKARATTSKHGGGDSSNDDREGELIQAHYGSSRSNPPRLPPQAFTQIVADAHEVDSNHEDFSSVDSGTTAHRGDEEAENEYTTTRFTHVMTEEGHAIITGHDGDKLQRCEDEPIHIPGAIQTFGLIIALEEEDGKFLVKIASENSEKIIGYTPRQLFALETFTDILTEEQADNLLDHIDFVRDEETDVQQNGPELFTLSVKHDKRRPVKLWCAMHINDRHPDLIICEFELENDIANPPIHPSEMTPDIPEDTLNSNPTIDEYMESTRNMSKPLRVLRSARKNRGEAAAMEVFNIMSQIQEQLANAPTIELFLKVLVGVVKELTGFHRVMIYQFDNSFNGRVVTELVDPRATKDLYKGLHFPASDIPKQARELYKINRVRLLYDRDQETARLVCRTLQDMETPLDLTHSYLRAMSPIHLKYLANMAVRSSMSISINAFNELWGLISCHSYGQRGMRVAFPIRKMCRLVGDTASRNIERLSYASRLQARKLINTIPTQRNPSGYIIASSEDLLKLFDADFGLLCIQDETKMLGNIDKIQESLAMLEYLKLRKIASVTTSQDITEDFPDLMYPPGFRDLAGMLLVPLSPSGTDFIAFFRKGQLREVKWAGNPYEKTIRDGTHSYLEPRKSFKIWSETVIRKCREWTEEEIETAAVLCLVYGKFIEVWRQKEAALQNSQLTKLLLANSAHEVRTPLNAIINYLEIALENLGTEGSLDRETRDYLTKSHSASKSLIYVINDLLDLTKTEEGFDLIKSDVMELRQTISEATNAYSGDAKRKNIEYNVTIHPGLPRKVLGDQRKVRQAISNVIANAIKHTSKGGVTVEVYVTSIERNMAYVDVVVEDTGVGISAKRLDALFMHLEQVQTDNQASPVATTATKTDESEAKAEDPSLGLGLAVVARIIRNMNGQLRLKSEEQKGSRFIIQFPFELPKEELSSYGSGSQKSSIRTPAPSQEQNEVLLVDRGREASRSATQSPDRLGRSVSNESMRSRKSVKSITASVVSAGSAKSDVDRLIEAIQGPHMVEGKRLSGSNILEGFSTPRPGPEKMHRLTDDPTSLYNLHGNSSDNASQGNRELETNTPGQQSLPYSGTPIKPIKVPEEPGVKMMPGNKYNTPGAVMGEILDDPASHKELELLSADRLNILVAEDDPVNSMILKKRLERSGHSVHLTVNGEDCATTYGDYERHFDVVLMDMQMPIVDGLTSTKMIREIEKSKSENCLSTLAALNGRVPIIAVSASLLEKERQTYIDAGFDAWILKPISFPRLTELMNGIVDRGVREAALYKQGEWEKGGWFHLPKPRVPLQHGAGVERKDQLSAHENPESSISQMAKSHSASQLTFSNEHPVSSEPITEGDPVQSPDPME